MEVICLANHKGGVGKTTLAFHLAWILHKAGGDVLAIDLDPQGNLSAALGVQEDESPVSAVLSGSHTVEPQGVAEMGGRKLDLLSTGMNQTTLQLVPGSDTLGSLRRYLHDRRYDFVVIDTPPALGMFTAVGFVAARWVLIPVMPTVFSMQGTKHVLKLVEVMKQDYNPKLDVLGFVVNCFDRTNASRSAQRVIQQDLGEERILGTIPRSVRVEEALRLRMPVFEYDPENPVSEAFKALALRLTTERLSPMPKLEVGSRLVGPMPGGMEVEVG